MLKRLIVIALVPLIPATASAAVEGPYNTFYGSSAGVTNNGDTNQNTFFGSYAGSSTTTGQFNSFFGRSAGMSNVLGANNTFMGAFAGYAQTNGAQNVFIGGGAGSTNQTGSGNVAFGYSAGYKSLGNRNVFLGHGAGYNETGSDRLYIDNCLSGAYCTSPLIYGEFDSHLLKFNGVLSVRADGVAKSQLHFSQNDTDTGGWLTSVQDNNFFFSSGARYDGTAGGWIQRSPDNSAVIAGSGGLGYRIFTNSGNPVGANFTPAVRLHIDYNGNLGLNTPAVAGTPIQHSSGAHLTAGGVWTDASSRQYKEHIEALTTNEALQAFAALNPMKFNYKVDARERYVGFIAEDVPELVARKDRRSLAPMDIVAVLTKVLQEKSRALEEQRGEVAQLRDAMVRLAGEVHGLQAEGSPDP